MYLDLCELRLVSIEAWLLLLGGKTQVILFSAKLQRIYTVQQGIYKTNLNVQGTEIRERMFM